MLNDNNELGTDRSRLARETAAAMRELAGTITDAPPLHQPSESTVSVRHAHEQRRWIPWAAPLAAAAAVIAVAGSLTLAKSTDNASTVPSKPTISTAPATTTGSAAVPRYYTEIKEIPTQGYLRQSELTVGDSRTGKTLWTSTTPAGTILDNVYAAADDRTFVISAQTSSTGTFAPAKGETIVNQWYEVLLAPGSADPVTFRRLLIPAASWAHGPTNANGAPGQIYSAALSQSGQELAIADVPNVPAGNTPLDWREVKVFSVATGKLLHDWTEHSPALGTAAEDPFTGSLYVDVPTWSALTWIDGDQALTLASSTRSKAPKPGSLGMTGTILRLNVAHPTSDSSLLADSTVAWSGTLSTKQQGGCASILGWTPQISPNGEIICAATMGVAGSGSPIWVNTYPLTAEAADSPTYVVPVPLSPRDFNADVLWISPTSNAFILATTPYVATMKSTAKTSFWLLANGKVTPLHLQVSLPSGDGIGGNPPSITF